MIRRSFRRIEKHLSRRLLAFSKSRSRERLYELMDAAIRAHLEPDHRVLSIGAGGETERVLRQRHLDFRSVDVDSERNPDILSSVESLPMIAASSIDVIFCMEVLEHVERPQLAIRELLRVLRAGGLLIGSTPFILEIHAEPHDFFRFTSHGLSLLFKDFEPLAVSARNGYFAAVAVLLLRPFANLDPRVRRKALIFSPLLLAPLPILKLLDTLLPLETSTTGYFFIFRKPGAA